MPTYEEITCAVAGRVATITLNRPDKLNAWTRQMEAEMGEAIRAAAADDAVGVIVITGAGAGFCAGMDLSVLLHYTQQSAPLPEIGGEVEVDGDVRADFKRRHAWLLSVPKPIIAAINGPAVGFGLLVTLYCDFRFASEKARFSTIFSKRGLVAEYGLAWILPRIVGLGNAIELLFTSKIIDASEALRIGLVSRVFPDENFQDRVHATAAELAVTVSPRSLRVMKRQIYNAQVQTLGEAFDLSVEEIKASLACDDFREGVAHFLEKRPAAFTGK